MNSSAVSPRAALIARSRRHFVAIAATGALLTGGLTAYAATSSAAAQPSSSPGAGSRSTHTPGSSSSGSGLTAPAKHAQPDAGSNAS